MSSSFATCAARYADTYVAIAQRVEFDLQQELDAISPEALGQIDTFQREETVVLEGALQALLALYEMATELLQEFE